MNVKNIMRVQILQMLTEHGIMGLGDLGNRLAKLTPPITAKSVGRSKLSSAILDVCGDAVELLPEQNPTKVRLRHQPKSTPKFNLAEANHQSVSEPVAQSSQLSKVTKAQLRQYVVSVVPEKGYLTLNDLRSKLDKKFEGFQPQLFGHSSMKTLLRGIGADDLELFDRNTCLRRKNQVKGASPAKAEPTFVWKDGKVVYTLTQSQLIDQLKKMTQSLVTQGGLNFQTVINSWCANSPKLKASKLGFSTWKDLLDQHMSSIVVMKNQRLYPKVATNLKNISQGLQQQLGESQKNGESPSVSKVTKARMPNSGLQQDQNQTQLLQQVCQHILQLTQRQSNLPLSFLGGDLREKFPKFDPKNYGASGLKKFLQTELKDRVRLVERDRSWLVQQRSSPSKPQKNQGLLPPSSHHSQVQKETPSPSWVYNRGNLTIHCDLDVLNDLSKLAMSEPWGYNDDRWPLSILKHYLYSTVLRHQTCQTLWVDDSASHAAFHTGLMSKNCEMIYGFLSKERYGWELRSFCLSGQGYYGKQLLRLFKGLPPKPLYVKDKSELLYDDQLPPPEVDWNHVLLARVGRIPAAILKEAGIEFSTSKLFLDDLQQIRACKAKIDSDPVVYRRLKSIFESAIDFSLRRLSYDFRLVAPMWRNETQSVVLALPLWLTDADQPDLALVVERIQDLSYQGHTIYPCRWVYNNARTLYIPSVTWLNVESLISVPEEEFQPPTYESDRFVPSEEQGSDEPHEALEDRLSDGGFLTTLKKWLKR